MANRYLREAKPSNSRQTVRFPHYTGWLPERTVCVAEDLTYYRLGDLALACIRYSPHPTAYRGGFQEITFRIRDFLTYGAYVLYGSAGGCQLLWEPSWKIKPSPVEERIEALRNGPKLHRRNDLVSHRDESTQFVLAALIRDLPAEWERTRPSPVFPAGEVIPNAVWQELKNWKWFCLKCYNSTRQTEGWGNNPNRDPVGPFDLRGKVFNYIHSGLCKTCPNTEGTNAKGERVSITPLPRPEFAEPIVPEFPSQSAIQTPGFVYPEISWGPDNLPDWTKERIDHFWRMHKLYAPYLKKPSWPNSFWVRKSSDYWDATGICFEDVPRQLKCGHHRIVNSEGCKCRGLDRLLVPVPRPLGEPCLFAVAQAKLDRRIRLRYNRAVDHHCLEVHPSKLNLRNHPHNRYLWWNNRRGYYDTR